MRAIHILGRATELVGGDRANTHGDMKDNFSNIATLWNAWLTIRRDPAAPLDAHDVAQMLPLLKKARTQSGRFNWDDYVDDVGYAGCAGQVVDE